jgi:HisJ family histidinol phosphate phosphatase
MKANYHTHTRWCRHGTGEIEEYIIEAIRLDFNTLAVTEHVPLPGDPEPKRMYCSELSAFDAELNGMIKKYASRITIIKGLE